MAPLEASGWAVYHTCLQAFIKPVDLSLLLAVDPYSLDFAEQELEKGSQG